MAEQAGERAGPEEQVVEYAILMSGGSMQIRPDHPDLERVYPLAEWIDHRRRHGGRVYTRTVTVVADWQEVTG